MMATVMDEPASKRLGEVLVAKIDTGRAQAISQSLNIRGIRTAIRYDLEKELRRQSGAIRLPELEESTFNSAPSHPWMGFRKSPHLLSSLNTATSGEVGFPPPFNVVPNPSK